MRAQQGEFSGRDDRRSHNCPIAWQAMVQNISRGSVYYKARPVSAGAFPIMRWIGKLHLDYPIARGFMLRRKGVSFSRRHVFINDAHGNRNNMPLAEHVEVGAMRHRGHERSGLIVSICLNLSIVLILGVKFRERMQAICRGRIGETIARGELRRYWRSRGPDIAVAGRSC